LRAPANHECREAPHFEVARDADCASWRDCNRLAFALEL